LLYICQQTPFDVFFINAGETRETTSNIVQPDIFIVCDRNKLDNRGCIGAPDLIIEILSPSTEKRDKTEKFRLYQTHGVLEYWTIDPSAQTVDRFILAQKTGNFLAKIEGF